MKLTQMEEKKQTQNDELMDIHVKSCWMENIFYSLLTPTYFIEVFFYLCCRIHTKQPDLLHSNYHQKDLQMSLVF